MEGEEIAVGEADPVAMQVAAEETVRTSATATVVGGQAHPGVGPHLLVRASTPGDVGHWPH